MELARFVGITFFNHFTDSTTFPLLVIGKDRWSFKEVAALGVIQPRACRILSKIAADMRCLWIGMSGLEDRILFVVVAHVHFQFFVSLMYALITSAATCGTMALP